MVDVEEILLFAEQVLMTAGDVNLFADHDHPIGLGTGVGRYSNSGVRRLMQLATADSASRVHQPKQFLQVANWRRL
jgi:hypothetical protein